jgi:cell division protein ZipA
MELEGLDDDAEPLGQGELDIGDESVAVSPKPRPAPRKPAGPPPEKIVTLFLLAADNHVITGAELLQATVNTGMEFGDMNIFHRIPEGSERAVFSMANAAKPGHFERDEWNTFETNGVVVFMTLPGPLSALDAWDSTLATARRMAEILHAELLDDERKPFTRQKEAQFREEMRDYDRQKSRQE